MAKLRGRIALITGGTSGIGAATAKLFQQEGATVIVTGSNPDTLKSARCELSGIEVVASDSGNVSATEILVDGVKTKHGRIDVLFVNAGIVAFAPIEMVDEKSFDAQFAVNVRGPYFLLKSAASIMADGGSIILTASIADVKGGANMSEYAATKAALRSFGRTFAGELAPRGIRVNTISPGPVETPIFGKAGIGADQMAVFIETQKARIPLKRIGRPSDIASAALFFASDESSFITGAELFVDGGIVNI